MSSRWVQGVYCPDCGGETMYEALGTWTLICVACPGDQDDDQPITLPEAPRQRAGGDR